MRRLTSLSWLLGLALLLAGCRFVHLPSLSVDQAQGSFGWVGEGAGSPVAAGLSPAAGEDAGATGESGSGAESPIGSAIFPAGGKEAAVTPPSGDGDSGTGAESPIGLALFPAAGEEAAVTPPSGDGESGSGAESPIGSAIFPAAGEEAAVTPPSGDGDSGTGAESPIGSAILPAAGEEAAVTPPSGDGDSGTGAESPIGSAILPAAGEDAGATGESGGGAGAYFDADGLAEQAAQAPGESLQFVFPEIAAAAISAWRPPLYPTPWAPTPFDHFYFIRPIAADQINWPLPDYRYGGVFFENITHTGVDIPAPIGAPVLAAGPGKVTWAGYGLYAQKEDPDDPYGLAVQIKHDFSYGVESLYTVYGHMSELKVVKGQRVQTGDLIGLVGDTGFVTGPHLHFEVRLGRSGFTFSRNPELWMSPPQGWGLLAGRVTDNDGELINQWMIEVISRETGQSWEVMTYGPSSTNSDPYYRENVVMGDLPAGRYRLYFRYQGADFSQEIQVRPGLVTYFSFRGSDGFSLELPEAPGADFVPAP